MSAQYGQVVDIIAPIVGKGIFRKLIGIGDHVGDHVPVGNIALVDDRSIGKILTIPVGGRIIKAKVEFIGKSLYNFHRRGNGSDDTVVYRVVTVNIIPGDRVQGIVVEQSGL